MKIILLVEDDLEYSSEVTERAAFKDFEDMFSEISTILCIVLTLIGILNFTNAILTGILTRSHELAVLKAIGMTDRQQQKMLIKEGLIYALCSCIVGIVLYSILHFPLVAMFSDIDYIAPQYSLLPMIILVVVFVAFGALIPTIVYKEISKNSVVERLRMNE